MRYGLPYKGSKNGIKRTYDKLDRFDNDNYDLPFS